MKIPKSWKYITNYEYIHGDFDKDKVPNIDDKRPFDKSINYPVQEVLLSDELKKIREYNKSYKSPAKEVKKELGGKYRIKGVNSTIGKLRREFLEKGKVEDIAGIKLLSKNYSGVKRNISKIKRKYKVKPGSFDDYYKKPKGGYYMAQHITIIKNNKPIEIQSKTFRQNRFHLEVHPFYKTYKPLTKNELKRIKIKAYKLKKRDMK